MARYILLILFALMTFGPALGLDLSLAPGLSVKNALLYLTLLLLAIESALARNRKVEMLSVLLPFALLFLYAGLTWMVIVIALDRPHYQQLQSLIALKGNLADHLLLLVVFFYGVTRSEDASWLMKALVWVVLASSIITVVDTFNIPDLGIVKEREDGRVMGFFGGPNESATVLAFYLPVALALYWNGKGLTRLLSALGLFAALLALMLFASRGAFAGILLGSALAALYLRQAIPATMLVRGVLVVTALIAVSAAVVFTSDFGQMLEDRLLAGVGSGSAFDLSSGRTSIWGTALTDMADAPITFVTGFGWNSYYESAGTRFATHNAYLGYLYDLGMIGLTLFMVACVHCVSAVRQQLAVVAQAHKPYLIALVWGMVCFMIGLLFCDIQVAGLYVWPFVGVGLRIALVARRTDTAESLLETRGAGFATQQGIPGNQG